MTFPVALFLVLSLAAAPALHRFEYARLRMGTTVRVVLYAPDEARAREAADAAYTRIDELEAKLSHYRAGSEVSSLSKASGKGFQSVSPELLQVLSAAVDFSEMSNGAFDVSVGPLVRLWKESVKTRRLPNSQALAAARALVGYRRIRIDSTRQAVALDVPGMLLDLSAIGKGYAADEALKELTNAGIKSALVDAGGDMRFSGAPPGRAGWKIAIQNTSGERSAERIIELANAAVATSGDAFQFADIGGRRYSHILDPRTGIGVLEAASATVVAPDGMTADALATALCVMRPEAGIRLVESLPGVSALVITREGKAFKRRASRGFPP